MVRTVGTSGGSGPFLLQLSLRGNRYFKRTGKVNCEERSKGRKKNMNSIECELVN